MPFEVEAAGVATDERFAALGVDHLSPAHSFIDPAVVADRTFLLR